MALPVHPAEGQAISRSWHPARNPRVLSSLVAMNCRGKFGGPGETSLKPGYSSNDKIHVREGSTSNTNG